MKRLTAITMAVLLVISGMICLQFPDKVYAEETAQNADEWDGTADTSWYDANNVKTEYTLTTAEQLAGLAQLVNAKTQQFSGITIKLGADIVLNEGSAEDLKESTSAKSWVPIGTNANAFLGNFDGQGHNVSGVYIKNTTDSTNQQAFIGVLSNLSSTTSDRYIKNINIVNSYIYNTKSEKVGLLVGQIYTNQTTQFAIENIYTQGIIESNKNTSRPSGVCSMISLNKKSTINFKNIATDADITSTNTYRHIGGIFSSDTSSVAGNVQNFENCVNMGNLYSGGNAVVGGIYGNPDNGAIITIKQCVNVGTLQGCTVGGAMGTTSPLDASGSVKIEQFVNLGTISKHNNDTAKNYTTGTLYGGAVSATATKTFTQCYSAVSCENNDSTEIQLTKEQLTSMNALQTLASNGFDTTNWTMVSGIAPLPTTAATMCGLTFKTVSLTLDSSMQMNFKVLKNAVSSYEPSKVVFALNGDTKEVTEYTDDGDYYVFSLSGIAPYQMQDKVTATLYGTYDTINFSTLGSKLSISDYCYAILNNSDYSADTYATLRTLIVDLLNYGAESQKRDGKTEDLVNAELTTEQQAMASVDRELVSVKQMDYATVNNPSVTWKSAGLNLTDKVVMRLKFSATDTTGLKVQFSDGNGHTVDVTEFTAVPNEEGCYYVYLSELNAYQMSDAIYATVFNAEGTAVSNTMCYSVESYAHDAQNIEEGNLGALVKAMMRYGNSAKAYQER